MSDEREPNAAPRLAVTPPAPPDRTAEYIAELPAIAPPSPPRMLGGWELGRTSRQMIDAPREAFYVWSTDGTAYPRDLARFLGRSDLAIRPRGWLRHGLRGCAHPVVLDHALVDRADYWEWEAWLRYVASR